MAVADARENALMSRHARKVDANHAAIVAAFRAAGASVLDLHVVGNDCPDLLVGVCGIDQLVEVKDGAKVLSARKLSDGQAEFQRTWRGRKPVVVETVEQAVQLVELAKHEARRLRGT